MGRIACIAIVCTAPVMTAAFRSPAAEQTKPAPPTQPSSGPGGSDYKHSQITVRVYGGGSTQYWVFEPASPQSPSAPLIVFNHGWGAMSPRPYSGWIAHLVRRGNIVVYPRYQADLRTPTHTFTRNAIAAIKDAIARLQTEAGHVRPDLSRFALTGHSVGGNLTPNIAALAASNGLPEPRALMSVQPGKSWNKLQRIAVPLEDLSKVPAAALLLTVVGDRDELAGDIDAKRIFKETTRIPVENKNYIQMVSDDHGTPALEATHFAPLSRDDRLVIPPGDSEGDLPRRRRVSRGGVVIRDDSDDGVDAEIELPLIGAANASGKDALDFYGFWKLFDALCDAAFHGGNRAYAIGDTPQQRFMGMWSGGQAVRELLVTTHP